MIPGCLFSDFSPLGSALPLITLSSSFQSPLLLLHFSLSKTLMLTGDVYRLSLLMPAPERQASPQVQPKHLDYCLVHSIQKGPRLNKGIQVVIWPEDSLPFGEAGKPECAERRNRGLARGKHASKSSPDLASSGCQAAALNLEFLSSQSKSPP